MLAFIDKGRFTGKEKEGERCKEDIPQLKAKALGSFSATSWGA